MKIIRVLSLILSMISMYFVVSSLSTVVTIVCTIIWFIGGVVFIFAEPKKKTDGVINIIDTDEKTIWQFELTSDAEKIRGQKTVTFGVKDSSS